MIFSIIIIALVAGIAFFHYTQGFWSATLSAVIAMFAAVLAIGYHESVVNTLLKGKMADFAHAIALTAVFGLTYLILRTISDKALPGNLRLPVIVDKAGAGVMGFVAAVFSVGVIAVAAQTLPFGPGVAGYTRYALTDDREVAIAVTGKSQYQEIFIRDQLDNDGFEDATPSRLLLPVDDWVIGLTSHLSDGGSLSGKRKLTDVHPAYLDELFAQRLGIQAGGAHVATNAVKQVVEVKKAFRTGALPQVDADIPNSRPNNKVVKWPDPKTGESLFVVRLQFNDGTADSGKAPEFVRFSPGSIRLVVPSEEGPKNVFPIGTVEGGTTLYANRLDDFLFTSEGSMVDVAFLVRDDEVFEGKTKTVQEGVFIEVKRLARIDLRKMPVADGITPDKAVSVLRKAAAVAAAKTAAAPAAAPAKKPAGAPADGAPAAPPAP